MNVTLGLSNTIAGLLIITVAIPLCLGKIRMNYWYGFRFSKSFDTDENWHRINAYGGRLMIFWGIPVVLAGILCFFIDFDQYPRLMHLMGWFPVIILIPTFQCWLYSRKL